MEVTLTDDVRARLDRMAAARGSMAETLAREAIERFVDYDEWFISETDKGLASADSGALLTHEEVGARLARQIAEKTTRA